jgi:hypothetical protein
MKGVPSMTFSIRSGSNNKIQTQKKRRKTGRGPFPFGSHVNQKRKPARDKARVYYDRAGNTLSVWFDDPKKQHVCEESDDDLILVKNRRGRGIGFERLNYLSAKQRKGGVNSPVEVEMG